MGGDMKTAKMFTVLALILPLLYTFDLKAAERGREMNRNEVHKNDFNRNEFNHNQFNKYNENRLMEERHFNPELQNPAVVSPNQLQPDNPEYVLPEISPNAPTDYLNPD